MRGELDCIACAVQQVLNTARVATDDEQKHEAVLREVIKYLSEVDWSQSPAITSTGAYHLLHRLTDNPDPYREMKREQNTAAQAVIPEMHLLIEEADDRLHTAARIAIVGNIIDCGIRQDHNIVDEMQKGMQLPVAVDDFEDFRRMFEKADKIFYALDNAGEIVFDKAFIEELKYEQPAVEIVACVRGGPILNDATIEDARELKLDDVATVIDTGIDAIGVPLNQVSDETIRHIEESDIIISKGQGNFETLDEITDGRVFFILRAKCPLIAGKFDVPLNSIIFEHYKPGTREK